MWKSQEKNYRSNLEKIVFYWDISLIRDLWGTEFHKLRLNCYFIDIFSCKYLKMLSSVNLIEQGNKALLMIPEIEFDGVKA